MNKRDEEQAKNELLHALYIHAGATNEVLEKLREVITSSATLRVIIQPPLLKALTTAEEATKQLNYAQEKFTAVHQRAPEEVAANEQTGGKNRPRR